VKAVSFRFDRGQLASLAREHHDEYVSAKPFPHVVIDDFLPPHVLDEVLEEFPSPGQDAWMRFESDTERKLASREDTPLGEATRHLLGELNSAAFIDFLETMTGINGLVPDPHFEGGGLHQIQPGGHLNVHVDFNRHPRTGLDRRLNVLIYLNRDWPEEYGGALELWGRDMQRRERAILPVFNRFVAFSTTERSYHGHPEPLSCPDGRTRKSLALYYYSLPAETPNGRAGAHNTLWQARPGDLPGPVPGEPQPRERVKMLVRRWAPPALVDLARSARQRSAVRD
jgi:hypothetical protein